MRFLKPLLATLALLTSLIALPALAQGSLLSFAAPDYDARHGGRQTTIEELKSDPAAYYRSPAVYDTARAIIGGNVGMILTDAGFKQLLGSDQITVVDCQALFSGKFTSAGVKENANAYWGKPRVCDPGEKIVMLGGMPLMSLDCLNPIKMPEVDCPCGSIYYEWRQEHPKG